jgi:hypothetical protein
VVNLSIDAKQQSKSKANNASSKMNFKLLKVKDSENENSEDSVEEADGCE